MVDPMNYILTLVTLPNILDQSIIDLIAQIIPIDNAIWLSEQEAIDISLPDILEQSQALSVFQRVKTVLSKKPVDVFLTHNEYRKKKLLVADMDSTIVQSETLDDLAAEVGIGEKIAAITRRAMNGELIFADALNERIALLKGVSADLLEQTWQHTHLNHGANTLVATMKKHNAYTALISGGFTFFTQKVADKCGFDENHANRFSIANNMLDGTVIPPILGKEAKLFHLDRLTKELHLKPQESLTIGDGANDLPMLTHAGLGIGYYPKPIVAEQITNIIRHTTLYSALFIQGYHKSDFVYL
ncbi:Phosphoserine phosphatase (SerB) (PDB:3N28) [Commensalibacter papalotli (ex Botero et al. 2024)]|uniref:Phosphoserine phosphatase n=2 Tax=Commensalibacter papalotli (ex Botero et al. 2024) TaxID=2972766 RepID=A0ABN8WBV8_9PROT|nr:Phosphoserine phosphatase (SerB) (PDB:3N28) [Commensalibacter papalotli (ex Botero et al. 2024)]CAI3943674.1 Phosphoserine phosphatase (SerB) (PDB:3N28) [Commensalibacter papalotli (ex Botero et al. 2024)]